MMVGDTLTFFEYLIRWDKVIYNLMEMVIKRVFYCQNVFNYILKSGIIVFSDYLWQELGDYWLLEISILGPQDQ